MTSTRQNQFKIVLGGLLVLLTYFLCEMPNFHPEEFVGMKYHWALDMFFHGGYYFVATLILHRLFCPNNRTVQFFLIVLSLSYFFELLQLLVPGRSWSYIDLLSNYIGISLATVIGFYLNRQKRLYY